ncbi:ThiF family protein [Mucilaginibacter oryzae]|uniref:ThiF family protein n=1 Tax=Mucilaginibacter oryzae TaxID=468058 RepID=A0A316GUZ2_9SPHI|nr:ThiF family adenylyltransferase [Mucilaginibacter oryzae]PWK68264.1 ThiF family protein [Mucilaginibacter oryzae]
MLQQLISRSPDLKRLRDEGYEIEIRSGYLIVKHIPYLDAMGKVNYGQLVSSLALSSDRTARPDSHIVYFSGGQPYDNNGQPIISITHSSQTMDLGGVLVNHMLSNKPIGGYNDYYEKVTTYSTIISAPAKAIDERVTEKTFKVIPDTDNDSVFQYIDTNSSRSNINAINSKLQNYRVGIVGLGGTGSYILDLVAKTPVSSIKLIDGDVLLQHNAFRSPGAITTAQLDQQVNKAVHFANIYSAMHKHIQAVPEFITAENLNYLDDLSFVFIAVDNNKVRKLVSDNLVKKNISFIDVGLGVEMVEDQLLGTLRITAGTPTKSDHLAIRIPNTDQRNDMYATNIQIADLNALNAALAVIKWKKIASFYQDLEEEHHSAYSINISKIFNEDSSASIR